MLLIQDVFTGLPIIYGSVNSDLFLFLRLLVSVALLSENLKIQLTTILIEIGFWKPFELPQRNILFNKIFF